MGFPVPEAFNFPAPRFFHGVREVGGISEDGCPENLFSSKSRESRQGYREHGKIRAGKEKKWYPMR
jgi:hypothetical protein